MIEVCDITNPLEVAARDDGQHLTGQGVLTLDRTAYGSHYGSGKLFRYLGQHVVNDHIHLHVKIHARREAQTPEWVPRNELNTTSAPL